MVQTKQAQTMLDLQNLVIELLKENGNFTLKESSDYKTIEQEIFRFPNQSSLVWGDFGVKKVFFVERIGEELIKKFNLREENGIIIVPTH